MDRPSNRHEPARALARALLLSCAAVGLLACGERTFDARAAGLREQEKPPKVERIDHRVDHLSTAPLSAGQTIDLHVRELRRLGTPRAQAVLMLHGASVPALPGFDLAGEREEEEEGEEREDGTAPSEATYSWALALARAGLHVFILDLQGSGRSFRPAAMDDPCNAPDADQRRALIPNPLAAACSPTSTLPLVTSASDWGELDTAIDFVRARTRAETVHLVAWSQGSFRVGPYAAMHPEKVASLFLAAPIYNPAFRSGTGPGGFGPPAAAPPAGTPMTVRTRADVMGLWDAEQRCDGGQVAPGVQDRVWDAIRREDRLGSTWGPPIAGEDEPGGVLRVRTPFLWGWNQGVAAAVTVPIAIFQGELDQGGGGLQRLPELYQTVASAKKLRFRVQCAGHFVPWEARRGVLHDFSREWIERGSVAGHETGEFFVANDGSLQPL